MAHKTQPVAQAEVRDNHFGSLEGSWSGVSVADVGRVVDCQGISKIIGEFCEN